MADIQNTVPQAVTPPSGRALAAREFWSNFSRNRGAVGAGIIVLILIFVAIFAPLIVKYLGDPPNQFHEALIDTAGGTMAPKGKFGGMSWDHLMGVEPVNGRDIFSRVVYGARISLLIALFATLLSVIIGTTIGTIAGFFGGRVDAFLSRTMDVFLAFPILVFALALAGVFPDEAFGLHGNTLRIGLLIFIIGFFNWPYLGRIVRGQTLSLREREFVDAARSLGARRPYILFEAALSYLSVGVRPPTATWGGMLSDAVTYYTLPHFMFWPGMAIFLTVLAFNLFGDGLRDALDPRTR